MVQLYINGKLCDVDEEMDIQLEKDFDNSEEHVIEEAEYSFEVELPITDGNRTAFGFVDVFDVGNKFNQVYDAVLNVDESNILVGKFILEEIDNEYYSGNLYVPAKKTLKDVLGDKGINRATLILYIPSPITPLMHLCIKSMTRNHHVLTSYSHTKVHHSRLKKSILWK